MSSVLGSLLPRLVGALAFILTYSSDDTAWYTFPTSAFLSPSLPFPDHTPSFGLLTFLVYAVWVLIAVELLSLFSVAVPSELGLREIAASTPPLLRWSNTDKFHLILNRFITIIFAFHTLRYMFAATLPTALHELTLRNTTVALPLLFIVYDCLYAPFHRLLHSRFLYPYIHKHHHQQVCPTRGHDDAANTHVIEFVIGEYMHLAAIAMVPDCHLYTALTFIGVGGIMASLNHTRFDIELGPIFAVRDHDAHHKYVTCNYGQYTKLIDMLMGTTREWQPPHLASSLSSASSSSSTAWRDLSPGALIARANRPAPPTIDALAVPVCCTPAACVAERARVISAQDAPRRVAVTGGAGFVGKRLVAMLCELGAELVISIDVVPQTPHAPANEDKGIKYITMDLSSPSSATELAAAFRSAGVTAVFHTAALVGPYHTQSLYEKVNLHGTNHVVAACRAADVRVLVVTGSPSAHMDGTDICGKEVDELPHTPSIWTEEYARTKWQGEMAAIAANSVELHTCVVAPHQVYGTGDRLFLPAFIGAARKLHVMGDGANIISMTHVDNVCHAHVLAANALARAASHTTAPAGQTYIVTDGRHVYLWDALDAAVTRCGFTSLYHKLRFRRPFAVALGEIASLIARVSSGRVRPRLNRFAIRMLLIHRYFTIEKLRRDTGYNPIASFEVEWPAACDAVLTAMKEATLKRYC